MQILIVLVCSIIISLSADLCKANATRIDLNSIVYGDNYDFRSVVFELPLTTSASGAYISFHYQLELAGAWSQIFANLYIDTFPAFGPYRNTADPDTWPSQGSYSALVPLSQMAQVGGMYRVVLDIETSALGDPMAFSKAGLTVSDFSTVPEPSVMMLLLAAGFLVFPRKIHPSIRQGGGK